MIRTVVLAGLCTVVGGFMGSGITRAVAQRHQHTHAVMWLAQFHLQRMQADRLTPSCQSVSGELENLRHLQGELVQAFPLPYLQDTEFRLRADALGSALREDIAAGGDCTAVVKQIKRIDAACDACHRQYR
jgi:hypothetical protein